MSDLLNKNIDYIYNILIDTQDYMQSIYNSNDSSEANILNKINDSINRIIRRIEIINEILEHKKGKWIDGWKDIYICSNCGNFLDFNGVNAGRGDANFCPNCGAKMDWSGDE